MLGTRAGRRVTVQRTPCSSLSWIQSPLVTRPLRRQLLDDALVGLAVRSLAHYLRYAEGTTGSAASRFSHQPSYLANTLAHLHLGQSAELWRTRCLTHMQLPPSTAMRDARYIWGLSGTG
jgi:hypothetical protein